MEYRQLFRGKEKISTIGLGLGNIHIANDQTIEETIRYAIENGINYFDLCGGRIGVYAATKFGVRAISETLREKEAAAKSGIRVTMMAPGMIATELPQSLTTQEERDGMQEAYDALAIPAESVAKSIAFAINMPENTGINEIIIRPTAQQL